MIELIRHISSEKLDQLVGSDFSFLKKLKLGGTGSMKLIHLEGINFMDNVEDVVNNRHFLSFEMRPDSLIGRTYEDKTQTFLIKKNHLMKIHFETFNLRILTKKGIVIRHEAIVKFELSQNDLRFYIPRSAYMPLKSFFSKDWLGEKTEYTVCKSSPEINRNALAGEIITSLLSQ